MFTKELIENIMDVKETYFDYADEPEDVLFGIFMILLFVVLIPGILIVDIVLIIPELISYLLYWRNL